MNKRTFADVFKDPLRNKQEGAGPRCLDNAVSQHFDYGYVTNSWKELLRRSVTLPKRMLIVQKNKLRDLKPELVTFCSQDSLPGRDLTYSRPSGGERPKRGWWVWWIWNRAHERGGAEGS